MAPGRLHRLHHSDRPGVARAADGFGLAAPSRLEPGLFRRAAESGGVVFAAFVCIVLVMPPNELAGKTLAGLLVGLGVLYFAAVRKRFKGPEWSHKGDGRP